MENESLSDITTECDRRRQKLIDFINDNIPEQYHAELMVLARDYGEAEYREGVAKLSAQIVNVLYNHI